MRVLMALIIIFNFIPNVVTADTFYMINKDKFNARILEEKPNAYIVRKENERYNVFFDHHTIEKKDIFTIINEEGDLTPWN